MPEELPPGSIEINGDADIRGTMGGVTGTFSGTFDANLVAAVKAVNVRNGSVSAYYTFQPVSQGDFSDISFVIPPFPEPAIYIISTSFSASGGYKVFEYIDETGER